MTRTCKAAIGMIIASFIAGWALSFATTHTALPVGAQCAQWQITLAAVVAIVAGMVFACSMLVIATSGEEAEGE